MPLYRGLPLRGRACRESSSSNDPPDDIHSLGTLWIAMRSQRSKYRNIHVFFIFSHLVIMTNMVYRLDRFLRNVANNVFMGLRVVENRGLRMGYIIRSNLINLSSCVLFLIHGTTSVCFHAQVDICSSIDDDLGNSISHDRKHTASQPPEGRVNAPWQCSAAMPRGVFSHMRNFQSNLPATTEYQTMILGVFPGRYRCIRPKYQ